MIAKCTQNDVVNILNIVNDAALKYKGVIPNNCWHEPYMTEQELNNEFANGVCMYGYKISNKLVGVMGIQKIKNITLIRHAYTLTHYQGKGVGKSLLQYLLKINKNNCILVGTWRNASWAIQFYEKFGFVLHSKEKTIELLKQYWKISSDQIRNSVVLEK